MHLKIKYSSQVLLLLITLITIGIDGCIHKRDKYNETIELKSNVQPDTINIYIVAEIIDGDTYKIYLDSKELKIRLIGVDTPESSKNPKTERDSERSGVDTESIIKMGNLATKFVHKYLAEGDSIRLEYDVQQFDRYNRILAYVYLMDGRMLNEILVREGYAQVMTIPPNVKYQELFLNAQRDARNNKRGLWADSLAFD